jgi:hypothetical protein
MNNQTNKPVSRKPGQVQWPRETAEFAQKRKPGARPGQLWIGLAAALSP